MDKQDRELTRMLSRNAECAALGRRLNAIAAKRHRKKERPLVEDIAIGCMAIVTALSLFVLMAV